MSDELVERVCRARHGELWDQATDSVRADLRRQAERWIAIIRPAVLEMVAADLASGADEAEKATALPTHNRAIAWALRSASLRYLTMAKEGT